MVKYDAHRDGHIPLNDAMEILRQATTIEEARENMALATELRLITVKEAAAKYGIPQARLRLWTQRGKLTKQGEQYNPFGRAHGLIDERELLAIMENPPKNGRPFKYRVMKTA